MLSSSPEGLQQEQEDLELPSTLEIVGMAAVGGAECDRARCIYARHKSVSWAL